MALDELNKGTDTTYQYSLPNGFRVAYAASDQAYYLTSIIRAVFEYDRHIRRMIVGLAGRNMRLALEIFLEFCTSGHISEDQIFKMRQSSGRYVLPLHIVVRVLLRMNRRFYDSDHSYVKNIFAADAKDARPNHFTRLLILRWLYRGFARQGAARVKGYISIKDMFSELAAYGIEEITFKREVEYLARGQCLLAEDFRTQGLCENDLVKLAPAGFVHLEMLGSVDFLAAVAEDTWFDDISVAREIAERIKSLGEHYQPDTAIANARDLLSFLYALKERDAAASKALIENSVLEELVDLTEAERAVAKRERERTIPQWVDLASRYPLGREVDGTVVNIQKYGVFVEPEPGVTGLIHKRHLPLNFESIDEMSLGERIAVKLHKIDIRRKRIDMRFRRYVNVHDMADGV